MNYLAPSILSADFSRLGEEVALVEESGLHILHIDVMDGMFVPSISFGTPIIKSLRKRSGLLFDVHLMVDEPGRYIDDFAESGADMITVHAEACTHLHRVIYQIKQHGKKCCAALNPATPLSALEYVLEDLDMVLIMTVNPGFGGQDFIPATLGKITALSKILREKNLSVDIEVDGGVTPDNAEEIIKAGANILVSGSCVFEGDIKANIQKFQKLLK